MKAHEIRDLKDKAFGKMNLQNASNETLYAFAQLELAAQLADLNEFLRSQALVTAGPLGGGTWTYPVPLAPLPTYPLPVAPTYPGYYPPTITCSKPLEEGEWKSDHVPTITTTPSAGCAGRATSTKETI